MGIMHAVYGVGAMCAPLVSTQFARLPHWSFVYLVHIGLAVLNAVVQLATFRLKSQNGARADLRWIPSHLGAHVSMLQIVCRKSASLHPRRRKSPRQA